MVPQPFARSAQDPTRRRSTDGVRVGLALVATALLSSNSGQESAFSLDLFAVFNDLPGGLRPLFTLFYDAGLYGAALLALAAVLSRRWRLIRDLLLAATTAFLVARGLGLVLESGFRGLHSVIRVRTTPTFPSVRLAVIVAVVATAGPYLGRSLRRASWSLAALLLPAELYLGVALPRSLGCALVLGWGVAAAVHLVFGSPAGRATLTQVSAALDELGLAVDDLAFAEEQNDQHALVHGRDAHGPLVVKVLGRDETDSRLLSKAWRLLYLKDSGPTLYLTREQEVQHNAYVMMLARDAGVRVPAVLTAGSGGGDTALLVERDVQGQSLADSPVPPDDAVLADTWRLVERLHAARIAHGRLNTHQVRLGEDGVTLVSFGAAVAVASKEQLGADVAELLATTAALVGHERAVRAAIEVLGPQALETALPLVQPAALSRQGRALSGAGPGSLGDHLQALRAELARVTGAPDGELEQLQRIRPAMLLLATGTIAGVGALLGSVGDPALLARSVRAADLRLLLLGSLLALTTSAAFAIALQGSVRRPLPFVSNVKLQLAGTFSNLALPLGSQALQVRYLQRHGASAASAVAAGGVVSVVATLATQVTLVPLALYASPQRVHTADIPRGTLQTLLSVGTATVLVLSLVVLVVPALRRRIGRPVLRGADSLRPVLRSPRQLALLFGGNVAASVIPALVLAAALASLGEYPSVWALIAITVGTALVASLVPFPGGNTAVTGVGLAAAVSGLGITQTRAVGAVLLYQAMTTLLPSVLGWVALRNLLAGDEL